MCTPSSVLLDIHLKADYDSLNSCVRFRPFLISIFVPINMHMSVYMQRAYLYRYMALNSAYIDVFYIHIFIAQDEYTGNTTWSWVRCPKGIPLHNPPVVRYAILAGNPREPPLAWARGAGVVVLNNQLASRILLQYVINV